MKPASARGVPLVLALVLLAAPARAGDPQSGDPKSGGPQAGNDSASAPDSSPPASAAASDGGADSEAKDLSRAPAENEKQAPAEDAQKKLMAAQLEKQLEPPPKPDAMGPDAGAKEGLLPADADGSAATGNGAAKAAANGPGAGPAGAGAARKVAAGTVVSRQTAADASQIRTTASGRRALRDISRFRGALDQGYKGSESALPAGDAGSYSLDAMRSAGAPSAPGAGPGSGSAAPARELDDVALAALSGRRAAVDALGLRVQAGADGHARVTRPDGAPASPAEVAALQRAVAQEPRALDRRPDFFRVLPPDHYAALKTGFNAAARPGAAPQPRFQDVGLAGQRDFEWTRSCSSVSGSCNPLAAESHYERGRDVSPETLESIYRSAAADAAPAATADATAGPGGDDAQADKDDGEGQDLGDFDADDEKLAEAARSAEGVTEHRLSLGGIGARLKSLFGGLDFGRAPRPAADSPAVSAAVPAPRSAAQTPASRARGASAAPAAAQSAGAVPSSAASEAATKDAAPRGVSRGAGLFALGAAALLAAAWALRRS